MHECDKTARVGVERTSRKKRKKLDRLTRDAIAAERAGMSYGKWKAQHPITPDEDDEPTPEEDAGKIAKPAPIPLRPGQKVKTCAQCGKPFAVGPKQTNKLYCSEDCRIKKNNALKIARRKRNKPGRPAVCPICGADFMADFHARIYCSAACYTVSQHRRNRERWKRHSENTKKEKGKNGNL